MSAPRQPPAACDDRHQLPSRKLGAEFLDAAAGILERLGGGRIGNAEMRTEAEGRAEHHGNTLLFQQRVAEILVVADLHAADRKSTRLTPVTNAHLVCLPLLAKQNVMTRLLPPQYITLHMYNVILITPS